MTRHRVGGARLGRTRPASIGRWALGAGAFFLLLPVLALAAAMAVVDPNALKPRLIAAVEDATGRTLSLDGPLRLTWSLWPTLEVDGARLSNLPGGSRPDMARAERIEARISLPALLRRRIEVMRLWLVGPNVLFEVVNGRPNWVLAPRSVPGPPARPSAGGFRLRVEAAHVQNGMVTWRLPERSHVVGLRTFDLRHPRDGALDLGGTLVYGDNQPFALHASARASDGLHGPWRTDIDFAAYDTDAHAKGTMTLAGAYDLEVEMRSGALEKLNALFPAMALPPVQGLSLAGHVDSNPVLGSLPMLGPLRLGFAGADLDRIWPGLHLARTTLSLPAPGGAATIDSRVRYRGRDGTLTGAVGVPRQPDARNDIPVDLALKTDGASLSLAGLLRTDRLRFNGMDAAVSLRAPALAALRPMLTPALPALTGLGFDGRVMVPADAGSIRVSGGRLATREGDLAGNGTIAFGAGTATVTALEARLTGSRLDLDAVLRAFRIDPSTASGAEPGFGDRTLPWTVAGGPAIDLTAAVDAATLGGVAWHQAALTLRRDRDRQAASLRVAMPDGPAELSMSADRSGPASLGIHAPGIPLALLAHFAGLPGAVSGTARVEASLRGTGRTVHDFAASLNGPVSITALDGRMTNAAFIRLTAGSLRPMGIAVPPDGDAVLRCLGLIGAAENGVVRLRTIALDSSYLSLSGDGEIDLGRGTVALKLHPLARVAGSRVAVPVVVDGPFGALSGRLDANGLDKVGLLLDGLFGGDRPRTCREAGLAPPDTDAAGTR